MIKRIANKENLLEKAAMLKKRDFKPGTDGMTADGVVLWIKINGSRLCRDILNGCYEPMPAASFSFAKKGGGCRRISKLTALDTVIQYAVSDAVSQRCEERFSERSFAYREGKGIAAAVELYCSNANRYRFAAKIDPSACFDNIDYSILEESVYSMIEDRKMTDLIMRFAKMPFMENGNIIDPEKGILQGAPLSPLLSNIYLHTLDMFLEKNGIDYIRYADDVVIFSDTLDSIRKHSEKVKAFMDDSLKLKINEKKFKIDTPIKFSFLGYKFESDKKGIIALEADAPSKTSFRLWHEAELYDGKQLYDILSDGILRQKDYSLLFETDSGSHNIPVEAADVINIYSDVVFDGRILKKAFKHGIEINVFEKSGRYLGRFTPNTSLRAPKITFEQLSAYYDKNRRLEIAKQFLLGSIHNLRLNIRYYNKQNPNAAFENAINYTYNIDKLIRSESDYDKLLLLESRVREVYFNCFDLFIENEDFTFTKRSRKPPRNRFNAMLSFGNTVLYNIIATEINKSSLDVRIGFLHATNTRMESLNLDIAELFKPLIVDRTIFYLVNRKIIKKDHFIYEENGAVLLSEEGKRIFLKAFYEKLNTVITVKKDKMNYRTVIKTEIHQLTASLKENKPYSSFRQVR